MLFLSLPLIKNIRHVGVKEGIWVKFTEGILFLKPLFESDWYFWKISELGWF